MMFPNPESPIQSHSKNAQYHGKEDDRPHKCISTNPRDDKEETCLTKSSMIVDEKQTFFIGPYPHTRNQLSYVGTVSLPFFYHTLY